MENEGIYFLNDSWWYIKRSVNMYNFTISYLQEGGFTSKEDAKAAKTLNDTKYEMDLKHIKKMAHIQYTFKEYIQHWMNDIFLPSTSMSSKALGIWAINNIFLPNVKSDVLLSYVTDDYLNDIIKACIPVCESAGTTCRTFLLRILKDAFEEGLMRDDLRKKLIPVPVKQPHIRLVGKKDLKKLIKEASKSPSCYLEILLAIFAGLRCGEIQGLKYDDFSYEKQTLKIARQYTKSCDIYEHDGVYERIYYMEEKSPKADSERVLRIPRFLFDELDRKRDYNYNIIQKQEALGKENLDREYVCLSNRGYRKGRNALGKSLERICHRAGIPPVSLHSLRHVFATILLEKGRPLEEISPLLGHKSVLTTFNYYCGIMDAGDDAREAVGNMIPFQEVLWG